MAFSKGGILAAWLLAALSLVAAERPRLAVLTDIGGDPDDQQSLIRLMRFFLPLGGNTPPRSIEAGLGWPVCAPARRLELRPPGEAQF